MSRSEAEILATLSASGADVGDLFIVERVIMAPPSHEGPGGEPRALVIEDEALADECIDYLRGRGAMTFESFADWMSTNAGEPTWYEPADPTPREQCPCCDYISLPERGNYLICPVCFWEDDGQDLDRVDQFSAPNSLTLRTARENFATVGACERKMLANTLPAEERARFERRVRSTPPRPA